MGLVEDLKNDGFDEATAETILGMVKDKPVSEARELLQNFLGDSSAIVKKYISEREKEAIINSRMKNMNVKFEKTKHNGNASSGSRNKTHTKYSTADKTQAIKDIEAAVESLSKDSGSRKACDCGGLKHGLLESAPNCLNCGRVVCVEEGLGPCLFCKSPLVPNEEMQRIKDILVHEKEGIIATMGRKALIAAGIDPSSKTDLKAMFASTEEAEKHLEKTLDFQANDAERTKIIDKSSDIDILTPGANQWATPAENALMLREQQRNLRILKEKEQRALGQGRKVLSIDIRGNKVYQVETDMDMEDVLKEAEEEEAFKEEETIGGTEKEDIKSEQYYEPKKFIDVKLLPDPVSKINTGADKLKSKAADSDKITGDKRSEKQTQKRDTERDAERDQLKVIRESHEIFII